jgi:hypothetical protein
MIPDWQPSPEGVGVYPISESANSLADARPRRSSIDFGASKVPENFIILTQVGVALPVQNFLVLFCRNASLLFKPERFRWHLVSIAG